MLRNDQINLKFKKTRGEISNKKILMREIKLVHFNSYLKITKSVCCILQVNLHFIQKCFMIVSLFPSFHPSLSVTIIFPIEAAFLRKKRVLTIYVSIRIFADNLI